MTTFEESCNEDTFKKTTSVVSDDACSKTTTQSSTNKITPFPISNFATSTSTIKNNQSEISDSSLNNSMMESPIVPLGNPNLKNLKYIESEIPIYANLYKIELERNYTLYEYAVNFIYEKDDKYSLSTPFKQRIINTASSKIALKYKQSISSVEYTLDPSVVTVVIYENAREVTVDKTLAIQRVLHSFKGRLIGLFPWCEKIAMLTQHLKNTIIMDEEEDGLVYQRATRTGDDHFTCAIAYALIAVNRLTNYNINVNSRMPVEFI